MSSQPKSLKFAQLLCFPGALPLPFLIFLLSSSILPSATPANKDPSHSVLPGSPPLPPTGAPGRKYSASARVT